MNMNVTVQKIQTPLPVVEEDKKSTVKLAVELDSKPTLSALDEIKLKLKEIGSLFTKKAGGYDNSYGAPDDDETPIGTKPVKPGDTKAPKHPQAEEEQVPGVPGTHKAEDGDKSGPGKYDGKYSNPVAKDVDDADDDDEEELEKCVCEKCGSEFTRPPAPVAEKEEFLKPPTPVEEEEEDEEVSPGKKMFGGDGVRTPTLKDLEAAKSMKLNMSDFGCSPKRTANNSIASQVTAETIKGLMKESPLWAKSPLGKAVISLVDKPV